jgi:predicted ester cyclase
LGIPASGKTVHVTGITIMRIANGKAVEGWQNWDMLGMMQQIQGGERAATYVAAL